MFAAGGDQVPVNQSSILILMFYLILGAYNFLKFFVFLIKFRLILKLACSSLVHIALYQEVTSLNYVE